MALQKRPYNFGAGPAMLPESLLLEAQEEFLNWQNSGVSILETGHRTTEFLNLLDAIEADLRELLVIPDNYKVLFLGMPARAQFAMVPLNLLTRGQQGAYIISGVWSACAYKEARKVKSVYCLASSKARGFVDIPDIKDPIRQNTTYVYYTPNETINGVRIPSPLNLNAMHGQPTIIADMTSCLLSEPINISAYGLIFAGAQKNIAAAGLTVVIVRDDLLQAKASRHLPSFLDYRIHSTAKSLYATPPTFNCYLAGKMFKWLKNEGGVSAIFQRNVAKATKLYDYIDASEFYSCCVVRRARSYVNICFSIRRAELETVFLTRAAQHGLLALAGHRVVGGLRASLYNAMPMVAVDALIKFMHDFAKEHNE